MKRELLIGCAGGLVGLGIGLGVAPALRPAPVAPAAPAALAGPAGAQPAAPPAAPPNLPASATAAPDRSTAAGARAFLAAWLAAGAPDDQRAAVHEHLEAWAGVDAAGALQFVASAARFPGRNAALSLPLAHLALAQPSAVVAWLRGNLSRPERVDVAQTVIARIAETDPAAALALASDPEIPVPAYAVGQALNALADRNPAAARAGFDRLDASAKSEVVAEFIGHWYARDADTALQWCLGQKGSPHEDEMWRGLLNRLVSEHLDQLDATIRRVPELAAKLKESGLGLINYDLEQTLPVLPYLSAEHQALALGNALTAQLESDPAEAVRLARRILPPEVAHAAVANAWQDWLGSDRKAATTWLAGLADPDLRKLLDEKLLLDASNHDPRGFLATASTDPAVLGRRDLVSAAIKGLAQRDPPQAAEWVRNHPAAADPGAVGAVARAWAERDDLAANHWMQSLPPGPAQERAYAAAIGVWLNRADFELASQAVAAVRDPETQTALRVRIFAEISQQDPDAAIRWLAVQPVHPEVRAAWIALMRHAKQEELD